MMRYFKSGLQTSTVAQRLLLLLAIAVANVNARVDCTEARPEVGREERNLTPTTDVFNVTAIQKGKTIYQDQTPSHTLLPLGNYTMIVEKEFSTGTLVMAYFVDGRLMSTSPCVDLNRHANLPLTTSSKVNITAIIMWRDTEPKARPTYSLAAISLFVPQANGSAVGQPSTAPYTTKATAGATSTAPPVPHPAHVTTTTGVDQSGTTPTSPARRSCTVGPGRKDCDAPQTTVASQTSQQPTKTASIPETSSPTVAIVCGVVGFGVLVIIAIICGWRWYRKSYNTNPTTSTEQPPERTNT